MFDAYMTAYPWDLVDGDLDAALDHLQGEIGITGLSVWAACGPLVQVRARGVERRVFSTDGGLLFQPESQHLAGLDCTPVVASWLGDRRPHLRIHEACAQRGLKLGLRLPVATTGRVAPSYPHLACRNAFGSKSRRTICPINPAARSYLIALAERLGNNGDVAALIGTDVYSAWAEAFAPELRISVVPGERQRALLAVCFCDSCMAGASSAGVDASAARDEVRTELDEFLTEPHTVHVPIAERDAGEDALTRHLRWQSSELGKLLAGIRSACRCAVFVEQSPADPLLLKQAAPAGGDGVETMRHVESDEQLQAALTADGACDALRFGSAPASAAGGESLISAVQVAVQHGISTVEFDNYGLLSDKAFDAIRRAIRYARRM